MSVRRYRVWAVVLVLHMLLGGWLVTVTDRTAEETPPRPLDAVLIQQVEVAPPERQSQTEAAQRADPKQPQPQPQPQRPVAPPAPVRQGESVQASKPRPPPLASPVPTLPPEATLPAPATAAPPVIASLSTPAAVTPAAVTPATAAAQAPATVAGTAVSNRAAPATAAASASASAAGATATATSAARVPASTDITVACPGQVAPEMPPMAIRGGVTGEVVAQALIVGGKVTEVRILSGAPVFHNAVRTAMLQYRCVTSTAEVRVTQQFSFRLE